MFRKLRNVEVWYWNATYTELTVKVCKDVKEAYKLAAQTDGKVRYNY